MSRIRSAAVGSLTATVEVKGRAQSIPELSDVGKIEKSCYLRAPKELEAHILRIRSTDEYYQSTKYEALTPSELRDRANTIFCQLLTTREQYEFDL